jgi:hypothetical protein
MADLVRRRGYPHHFIGKGSMISLAGSLDWRNPIRFAESIGYQLIRDYGGSIMSWDDWGINVSQHVKDLQGLLMGAKVATFNAAPRNIGKPKLTVEQEIQQFGDVAQVVGVYIDKFVMDMPQIVRQLLIVPLENIGKRWPDHQVVIIIDGLDEASGYSDPHANILKITFGSLPKNIRFLLSSRPGEHINQEIQSNGEILWMSENEKNERNPHIYDDAKSDL